MSSIIFYSKRNRPPYPRWGYARAYSWSLSAYEPVGPLEGEALVNGTDDVSDDGAEHGQDPPGLTITVELSIDACIEYREHLFENALESPPDALGLARAYSRSLSCPRPYLASFSRLFLRASAWIRPVSACSSSVSSFFLPMSACSFSSVSCRSRSTLLVNMIMNT